MTSTPDTATLVQPEPERDAVLGRASENFACLMQHVARLYCMEGSSSVSAGELQELSTSVAYVLGIVDASPEEAARVLDVDDPIGLWREALSVLDERVDAVLDLRREVMLTMPPLRNVALRDTLASLGDVRLCYDMRFAAHEVPCSIDYQLSSLPDVHLMGIDYVEEWLAQLLAEARWMAQYSAASCERVLESVCPDYVGLHVNLYDLLLPHAEELELV